MLNKNEYIEEIYDMSHTLGLLGPNSSFKSFSEGFSKMAYDEIYILYLQLGSKILDLPENNIEEK